MSHIRPRDKYYLEMKTARGIHAIVRFLQTGKVPASLGLDFRQEQAFYRKYGDGNWVYDPTDVEPRMYRKHGEGNGVGEEEGTGKEGEEEEEVDANLEADDPELKDEFNVDDDDDDDDDALLMGGVGSSKSGRGGSRVMQIQQTPAAGDNNNDETPRRVLNLVLGDKARANKFASAEVMDEERLKARIAGEAEETTRLQEEAKRERQEEKQKREAGADPMGILRVETGRRIPEGSLGSSRPASTLRPAARMRRRR